MHEEGQFGCLEPSEVGEDGGATRRECVLRALSLTLTKLPEENPDHLREGAAGEDKERG